MEYCLIFDGKWVIRMSGHPFHTIAESTVAIHGINDLNLFFRQFKVEHIKVLNDARLGHRFRNDNDSAFNLEEKIFWLNPAQQRKNQTVEPGSGLKAELVICCA